MELTLDNVTLVGDIEEQDASFDHDFGTHKDTDTVLKDFSIIVWANDFEVDITDLLEEKQPKVYEYFKNKFLTHFTGVL